MKTVSLLLLVAGLAHGALFAQNSTIMSKLEEPDVYDFGFPTVWEPRYKHDPKDKKLILNPDFYCSECAAEGRIAAKSRDEMAELLEITKRYPTAMTDGKSEDHFGSYRLMERPAEGVLEYVFKKMKLKNPCFIEDGFFRLVIDLPSFHSKLPPFPRREFELQQLGDIFPKVSEKTIVISPHQRAHLYLFRAHRVRLEFEHLVGHRDKANYMDYAGPYLGMRGKWELYVFDRQPDVQEFVEAYIGQNLDDGLCWHLLSDKAMQIFLHGDRRKDVWINNTFTHRLSYALLTGYRAYQYDMPAWLALGYAHLMERRERTDFNTFIFGEGAVPDFDLPAKWKVGIRKAMLAGEYRPFQQIAEFQDVGKIMPAEHPLVWSIVSYLVQLDQEKFARFVHVLKEKKAGESMRDLVRRALAMSYGKSLTEVDEGWQAWVKETYPTV
ncbi:MAG: hypothetical protein KDB53_13350 [Planctomycetes bacterium]|nr:hypothetical protein [Planctomycetota bacterium]